MSLASGLQGLGGGLQDLSGNRSSSPIPLANLIGAWFKDDAIVDGSNNVTSWPGRFGQGTLATAGAGGLLKRDATGVYHPGASFPTDARYFTLPAQINLAADMSAWMVYSQASGGILNAFSKTDGTDYLTVGGGTIYEFFDGSSKASLVQSRTGLTMTRWRRLANNSARIISTGLGEVTGSAVAGTFTFDNVLGAYSGSYSLTSKCIAILLYSADMVTAGKSTQIESYLTAVTGATL